MIIQRSQVPPGIVVTGELHYSRHHHQFEEKKLEQEQSNAGNRRPGASNGEPALWSDEDRQKSRFNEQDVPLKTEERLSNRD